MNIENELLEAVKKALTLKINKSPILKDPNSLQSFIDSSTSVSGYKRITKKGIVP